MLAIVDGNECEVTPSTDWVERELASIASRSDNRFFALLRRADDQWNVLAEPAGFVLEHYRGEEEGPHVAFREREGIDQIPGKRVGFFASLLGAQRSINGSRLTVSEARAATESWLSGEKASGLRWERRYR